MVLKAEENKYLLGETGRKILAPTYEGEREEGIKKALFTPSVLSRFYTDYNGSLLPSEDLLPNVLETRYDVPRERTKEAIALLKENARYGNALLVRQDGKEELRFSDAAFPVSVVVPVPRKALPRKVRLYPNLQTKLRAPRPQKKTGLRSVSSSLRSRVMTPLSGNTQTRSSSICSNRSLGNSSLRRSGPTRFRSRGLLLNK